MTVSKPTYSYFLDLHFLAKATRQDIIIVFGLIFFVSTSHLIAQEDSIRIQSIDIVGNTKTKSMLIMRELDFEIGDKICLLDTATKIQKNKNKMFNMGLFVTANIYLITIDSINYQVLISVKERWYIWPIPIVELADRNFNEWWNQRNHSLSRIEWGIRFRHDNFLGRNQKLKMVLQAGFTKKYEIFHEIPYIDKDKTWGLNYGFSYSTNKNVGYKPELNKLVFYNSENVLRKRFFGEIGFSYRQKYYTKHQFRLSFHKNEISKELLQQTTGYLGLNEKSQTYLTLGYNFDRNKTNINYYPTKGNRFNLSISQHGIKLFNPLFVTEAKINYTHYFELTPKLFAAHRLTLKGSTPIYQPYLLQYGLGFGEDFVRGYQAYIIDGQSFALNRNELKYRVLGFTAQLSKFVPIKEFETVPYAIYLKLFADAGYVQNQDWRISNQYANKLGQSFGIGLDIVSYYDAVIRLELSQTNLGKTGFNIQVEKGI